DHHQAPRANLAFDRLARNRFERVVREAQAHAVVLEFFLVLLDERVLRFGENAHQRRLVQFVQHTGDGEPTDKFWNQTVPDQIFWLHGRERIGVTRGVAFNFGAEAERLVAHASLDHFFKADERAAADEQNVRRVNGEELL